jgi:hypothetical protein
MADSRRLGNEAYSRRQPAARQLQHEVRASKDPCFEFDLSTRNLSLTCKLCSSTILKCHSMRVLKIRDENQSFMFRNTRQKLSL